MEDNNKNKFKNFSKELYDYEKELIEYYRSHSGLDAAIAFAIDEFIIIHGLYDEFYKENKINKIIIFYNILNFAHVVFNIYEKDYRGILSIIIKIKELVRKYKYDTEQ